MKKAKESLLFFLSSGFFFGLLIDVYAACPAEEYNLSRNINCVELFIGASVFQTHELWEGRGNVKLATAKDGTVIANKGGKFIRSSSDGGKTWSAEREIGYDAGGNLIVNENTGEVMIVNGNGYRWISNDNGNTWRREEVTILPDGFGHGSSDGVPVNLGAFQSGITLMYGEHKGRLLMPGRIFGPENSNAVLWRPYHYNTAIFSDDGGRTWQTSRPFPVLGTGEAALAEISDGNILYNSREHMSTGNRFIAWSHDGGDTWLNAYRCPYLPDGVRGSSYGCMGGLIRLPVEGHDILIYSNLDTDRGVMPGQIGGSTSQERENVTVWVSFDGGLTWPVNRRVFDGPSAYSSLGVGRNGTPSEGKIFLIWEGGPEHHYQGVNVSIFNMSWIINGKDINDFIK